VPSLLDRFRRPRRPAGVACYLRENGPIAYELALFGEDARERIEAMFETGLAWYWSNMTKGDASAVGEWIELTRWSMAALQRDLGGLSGAVTLLLVGIEPRQSHADIGVDLAGWGREFAVESPSPLQMVIHRSSAGLELVFVAQQAPENIRTLLQAWGIDRARADRRAYARLREQSLEAIVAGLR
jgi:hypothetical protein